MLGTAAGTNLLTIGLSTCVSAKTPKKKKYPVNNKLMCSLENSLNIMYRPNNAIEAIIGNIAASLVVIVSCFCSLWTQAERYDPKNMGKRAIITRLPYATAIPSGVLGGFVVAFAAVSLTFSAACATIKLTTLPYAIFPTKLTKRERETQTRTCGCVITMTTTITDWSIDWIRSSHFPRLQIQMTCIYG
uniref:Amino acid permease/ SLC12A domain-containing protein n=1 Tax=Photinus pyralis TaxID=7054 RepID=A0A1Y1KJE8_PHOPY